MSRCFPGYRVRLFLSADIVGSTAFKAGRGKKPGQDRTIPSWVSITRDFYVTFARRLTASFDEAKADTVDLDAGAPLLWKIIGDELVFCCRVTSLRHLSICMQAFIETVHAYTDRLKALDPDLAIKANGWVAAFPSVNVLVPLAGPAVDDAESSSDEAEELRADVAPGEFEFLGTDIDAGFRVGVHATESRFSVSCGLAVLLAEAYQQGLCAVRFGYHGRSSLKGVIGGRPYPVVTVDMERDAQKVALRHYEDALLNRAEVEPSRLVDFLRAFMHDEFMDLPRLASDGEERASLDLPRHYRQYKLAWEATYVRDEYEPSGSMS